MVLFPSHPPILGDNLLKLGANTGFSEYLTFCSEFFRWLHRATWIWEFSEAPAICDRPEIKVFKCLQGWGLPFCAHGNSFNSVLALGIEAVPGPGVTLLPPRAGSCPLSLSLCCSQTLLGEPQAALAVCLSCFPVAELPAAWFILDFQIFIFSDFYFF